MLLKDFGKTFHTEGQNKKRVLSGSFLIPRKVKLLTSKSTCAHHVFSSMIPWPPYIDTQQPSLWLPSLPLHSPTLIRPHALSTLPHHPFSDLFPPFHCHMPEFRPITSHWGQTYSLSMGLHVSSLALPTHSPTANLICYSGPQHPLPQISSHWPNIHLLQDLGLPALHFLFMLSPTCTANSRHSKTLLCHAFALVVSSG